MGMRIGERGNRGYGENGNGKAVLEWEWVGMGMTRWEWEGNGNKKVIPAYCSAQTANSHLPIKILTSPLNSATQISQKKVIICRSVDVFTL